MIADDFRKAVDEFRDGREIKLVAVSTGESWEDAVFLANADNSHIRSAVEKITEASGHGLRGRILMLTQEEFDAIINPHEFRAVSLGRKEPEE